MSLARRPASRPGARAARGRARALTATLLAAAAVLVAAARADGAGLPYGPLLGRAYDAVLDARFGDVEPALREACGPAPREACDLVRVTALWWRIQIDPFNRSLDAPFERQVEDVIDATARWTDREPRRAEAWFFLGAAYGVRVQYRVLRTERLAAARDGKRIKNALERALALDPSLQDAYFGIGLYHYYADLGPAVLKLLVRWVFFLPGGDRERGLREMLQARERGELLRGETDFQIHLVYLWYEQRIDEALALVDDLRARYPRNPLFIQAAAEVRDVYLHDHAASLDVWRAMLALAREGRLSLPEMSEARARVGIADELDALSETDAAVEQLRLVLSSNPRAPYGIAARAALKLGQCHDRLGRRADAVAAYRAAIAAAPPDDPGGVRRAAAEHLRRPPDARASDAYRLSIDGWRALQRGDLAQAADALNRSAAIAPAEPATRYRLARLMLARRQDAEALEAFERILALRPVPPPTILAASCVEAARLRERTGDRAGAADLYLRATRVRGADAGTRREANAALARLR